MNQQEAKELTRLINCLVSRTAKDDLYSRFDDVGLVEVMNGLTPELADIGFSWWAQNHSLFKDIVVLFEENLLLIGKKTSIDLINLFEHFDDSTWADFIRESFYFASDLILGDKNLDDLDEFFKFAVKMSLEYSGKDDSVIDLLDVHEEAFQVWWREREPFKLFSEVFAMTSNGREMINRG